MVGQKSLRHRLPTLAETKEQDKVNAMLGQDSVPSTRPFGFGATVGLSGWRFGGAVLLLVLVLSTSPASTSPVNQRGSTDERPSEDFVLMQLRNLEEQQAGLPEVQEQQQQQLSQRQLYLPSIFRNVQNEYPLEANQRRLYQQQQQQQQAVTEDETVDETSAPQWTSVVDPQLYVLNEYYSAGPSSDSASASSSTRLQQRKKRSANAGPSLSITNSLDVLRQRLLLEIARRKLLKNQNQIMANAQILKTIG